MFEFYHRYWDGDKMWKQAFDRFGAELWRQGWKAVCRESGQQRKIRKKEIMFSDNRNYKFYDCLVKSYVLEEDTNILILSCQYLDRGVARIALRGACGTECLEVLVNHVIEYVVCSYDGEKKTCCYEIHLKNMLETAKVWAEDMEFL